MKGLASVAVCGLALMMALTVVMPGARAASLPSGEMLVGKAAVEPAYNDMNGNIVYLLTPIYAPENVKSPAISWAPLYLVAYPAGSTVGTLNCMGVPGNCPDHDGAIAGAATTIMPSVYGTDPSTVIGHDHLVAAPASGGDFNIAWHVYLILFTNTTFVNQHLTTLAAVNAALAAHQVIQVDSGIVFTCTVVSATVYDSGTPVTG